MPKTNQTFELKHSSPYSLEAMPADIQHRITHFAGTQSENAMMLLNRGFHRRLSSFRAQHYRDGIENLLVELRCEHLYSESIERCTQASTLRRIFATLHYLKKNLILDIDWTLDLHTYNLNNIDIDDGWWNYAKRPENADRVLCYIINELQYLGEFADLFTQTVVNNMPIHFSEESPPTFSMLIIAVIMANKPLKNSILGFDNGDYCAKWLSDEYQAELLFRATCISGEHQLFKSLHSHYTQLLGDTTHLYPYQVMPKSEVNIRFLRKKRAYALWWALLGDHLDTAQWILEIYQDHLNLNLLAYAPDSKIADPETASCITGACITGKIRAIKWFLEKSKSENGDMNSVINDLTVKFIKENGHFEILKWLWDNASEEGREKILGGVTWDDDICDGMYNAAKNGHFEMTKWLWLHTPETMQKATIRGDYTSWAAEDVWFQVAMTVHYNFDLVKWVWENSPDEHRQLLKRNYEDSFICFAIRHDRVDILQWILETFYSQEKLESNQDECFYAGFNAEYIAKYIDPSRGSWYSSIYKAIEKGHVNTARWFWELHSKQQKHDVLETGECSLRYLYITLDMGHLDAAQWLWKLFSEKKQHAALTSDKLFLTFQKAINSGQTDIAQWLWKLFSEKQQHAALTSDKLFLTFQKAINSRQIDMAQWLLSTRWSYNQKFQLLAANDFRVFRSAAKKCYLDGLKFLWAVCPKEHRQTMLAACDYAVFCRLHSSDQFDISQWLWDICHHEKRQIMLATHDFEAFSFPIQSHDSDMLLWLWERASPENKQRIKQKYYINNYEENLSIFAQLLFFELPCVETTLSSIGASTPQQRAALILETFHYVLKKGHLEAARWLWDQYPQEIQSDKLTAEHLVVLVLTIKKEHNNTAQWLWNRCSVPIRKLLNTYNGELFCTATSKGYLKVARWLWNIFSNDLTQHTLSINNYKDFCMFIEESNFDSNQRSSQASLQQLAMLAADDFSAFRNTAVGGHFEILQWLWQICPKEHRQTMLEADNFSAFSAALSNRQYEIAQWLWGVSSRQNHLRQNHLRLTYHEHVEAIIHAAKKRDVATTQWLWSLCTNEKHYEELLIRYAIAFRNTALGTPESINMMFCCTPDQKLNILAAERFKTVICTAKNGQHEMAQFFWDLCMSHRDYSQLITKYFQTFLRAVETNREMMAKNLWHSCPQKTRQRMLANDNYVAFRRASSRGHINTTQLLWHYCPEEEHQTMLATNDFEGFRNSVSEGSLDMARWLWKQANLENKQRIAQLDCFDDLPANYRQKFLSNLPLPEGDSPQPEIGQTSMSFGF